MCYTLVEPKSISLIWLIEFATPVKMKDGVPELKRLKIGILVAILVFISPVILALLFPPFSPLTLAGFIVIPVHPIFALNDQGSTVLLFWDILAVPIGVGSAAGLSLLYARLRERMSVGSTLTFTLAQKLRYFVSVCLLMGGIVVTGIGTTLTVANAMGWAADASILAELLSVAGLVGGIAALVIGAILYRTNNPLANREL